jgi:hypothetical protein
VTTTDSFSEILRSVCAQRGWEILPSGVNVQLSEDRHQVVSLEFFEFRSQQLVRLLTIIGKPRKMGPERLAQALSVNSHLPHGALAMTNDELCMTDTLMLKDADPEKIEASIDFLSEQADHYERILFGTDEH